MRTNRPTASPGSSTSLDALAPSHRDRARRRRLRAPLLGHHRPSSGAAAARSRSRPRCVERDGGGPTISVRAVAEGSAPHVRVGRHPRVFRRCDDPIRVEPSAQPRDSSHLHPVTQRSQTSSRRHVLPARDSLIGASGSRPPRRGGWDEIDREDEELRPYVAIVTRSAGAATAGPPAFARHRSARPHRFSTIFRRARRHLRGLRELDLA